eukprot:859625_1
MEPSSDSIDDKGDGVAPFFTDEEFAQIDTQVAISQHPLFPFVLRAINDWKGEHLPYLPPVKAWQKGIDAKSLSNNSTSMLLIGILTLFESQQTTAIRINQKSVSFCRSMMDDFDRTLPSNGPCVRPRQHSKRNRPAPPTPPPTPDHSQILTRRMRNAREKDCLPRMSSRMTPPPPP